MEQSSSQAGMILYNYNPVDGTITPTSTPVQIEFGSADVARQINQQVQLEYSNLQGIQPGQTQQIVITSQPTFDTTEDIDPILIKGSKAKIRSNGHRVPCPICGKTYSCNANLRDHMRLHTGERPFQCSECGMSFAQRSNWRLHKRVHTGERPYMCGICGKTFPRSSHLPGHIRVHTGERPFQCSNCDHSFSSSQALKNHVRTHTGEKPFECAHCSTTFTHSSTLSSHKKRCTGEKRKRGRPVGSSRRKRRSLNRSRGRPKKGRFGRPIKKKESIEDVKNETITEHFDDVLLENYGGTINENDDASTENIGIATDSINSVNGEREFDNSLLCSVTESDSGEPLLCNITNNVNEEPLLCKITEISNGQALLCTQSKTDNAISTLSENSNPEISNEYQEHDVKPVFGHDLVPPVTDAVDVKPDIRDLPDPSDLRQEAAVAMTTLHNSVINNLPTDVN